MGTSLYTAAQVRELDRTAIRALGISGHALMRRAADSAWRTLRTRWPQAGRMVVLCGAGNNGGDGYLMALLAREAGMDVELIALAAPKGGDAAQAHADWQSCGGKSVPVPAQLSEADVYVDALFGTGLARVVDGPARLMIEQLNARDSPVLALDVPSGLCADTGNVLGIAVCATTTVTFVAHKRGLFTAAAMDYCGDLILDRLGLPETLYTTCDADAQLLDLRAMMAWLPARAHDANKGLFGHVLAIGGDEGMGGAIRLAGEAALRVGAGLVSVATRPEHVIAMNAARPELMVHGLADAAGMMEPLLQRAGVVALGPGLGRSAWSKALWQAALAAGKPTVLDADGLNLLALSPQSLPAQTVLTPHPGEAARLLACDTSAITRDRFAAARKIARQYGAVAVLKGAGSLIASPAGRVAVCPWGNPGMASAGMGDVLTGVIGGLLAQGLDPWRAACLGVALHAQAGDVAAINGQAGTLASDLFDPLRKLRNARTSHD